MLVNVAGGGKAMPLAVRVSGPRLTDAVPGDTAAPAVRSGRAVVRSSVGRAATIGLVYWIARLLAGAAMSTVSGAHAPEPIAELAAGCVIGGLLTWVVPRLRGTSWARAAIVGALLYVNVAAVMIEGSAFAPEASPAGQLPLGLLVQAIVAIVVANAAVVLLPSDRDHASQAEPRGRAGWWAWRLAATSWIYVAAYFVTGALNYALVTGPYYKVHAGGLTTPAPQVVLGIALFEGLLLSVGTVLLVRRLRARRRTGLLAAGLVLFLLGGVVPLIQATNLPFEIRVASAVEILFQKFPLGFAIGVLFGSRNAPGS